MDSKKRIDLDFYHATIKAQSLAEFNKEVKAFQEKHNTVYGVSIIATVVISSIPLAD